MFPASIFDILFPYIPVAFSWFTYMFAVFILPVFVAGASTYTPNVSPATGEDTALDPIVMSFVSMSIFPVVEVANIPPDIPVLDVVPAVFMSFVLMLAEFCISIK